MDDTLRQFLTTGELAGVRLGMTAHEASERLGHIQEVAEFSGGKILRFGYLQLTFRSDALTMIAVTCLPTAGQWPRIEFQPPASSIDLYGFLSDLDSEAVEWSINPKMTFDRSLCLRAGSADVYFDLDRRELQKLIVTDVGP